VHVLTSRSTVKIVDGAEHRHRMVFEDGSYHETDMIVFSAGIRPRDELARQCVLAIGPRGGVVIDERTVAPAITTSTPLASARHGATKPSAWWPPATTWPVWRHATLPATRRPRSPVPT
jgi:NADPH-dependent 2,4-dienoyl-CoA reductase/sulfur reductase-like enzyme